jgi:hypothetical protein
MQASLECRTDAPNGVVHKTRLAIDANTDLEAPVTLEEIKTALRKGKKGKSPGSDVISHEFYTENWCTIQEDLVEIIRQMHSEGIIKKKKKTWPTSPSSKVSTADNT